MSKRRLIAAGLIIFSCVLFWQQIGRLIRAEVHAQDVNEVKPYVFADLPHGRIYKTVHEGCEVYIVESDTVTYGGQYGFSHDNHSYAVATGRGCH